MGYIVDLTLILQAVFRLSHLLRNESERIPDCVHGIIHDFHSSQKKLRIHGAIWTFVGNQEGLAKDTVIDKITSLIKENEVGRFHALNALLTVNAYAALQSIDSQLESKRSTLSSLLTTIKFEVRALSQHYCPIANEYYQVGRHGLDGKQDYPRHSGQNISITRLSRYHT